MKFFFSVNIGAMCSSSALSWTSACVEEYREHLNIEQASWVGALLSIGALCSALPSGGLADRYGRRIALLVSVGAPLCVSWPVLLLAGNNEVPNTSLLYIGRLLAGIGLGGACTLAPMYIGETVSQRYHSRLGALFPVFFCFGIFLTHLLHMTFDFVWLTRLLAIGPLVFVVLILWLAPESPVWLASRGKDSKMRRALYLLGRYASDNLIEVAKRPSERLTLSALVKRSGYRHRLIACVLLFIFQQLSGINALMFYTETIFRMAESALTPLASATLVAGLLVTSVVTFMPFLDNFARRTYLLWSAVGMAVSHASLAAYLVLRDQDTFERASNARFIPVVSLLVYVVAFSVGFGTLPWVIVHELSTPKVATYLTAAATLANWTTAAIVTKSFGPTAAAFGEHAVFFCFTALCVLGALQVILFVPETRFKQHHEIFAQHKL